MNSSVLRRDTKYHLFNISPIENEAHTMSTIENNHKILSERIQRHLRCGDVSNEMFLLDIEVLTSSILKEVKA